MSDIFVLVILGIGLTVLEYCVDKYIFGNNKYATIVKIVIFASLILLVSFATVKDLLSVLIVMLFIMTINKLRIIVRGIK